MVTVLVSSEKPFAVNFSKVRQIVKRSLSKLGCPSNAEVSVSFVTSGKMAKISRQYFRDRNREVHEILSFPFINKNPLSNFPAPDKVTPLGEIVISHPQAVKLANEKKKLISDEIDFLLDHGCRHLMGRHHR